MRHGLQRLVTFTSWYTWRFIQVLRYQTSLVKTPRNAGGADVKLSCHLLKQACLTALHDLQAV